MDERAEYIAYCCAVRGNRESTVAVKLVAVQFFHEQWMRKSLTQKHFRIKTVREWIKGTHGSRHPATDYEADTPHVIMKNTQFSHVTHSVKERKVLVICIFLCFRNKKVPKLD